MLWGTGNLRLEKSGGGGGGGKEKKKKKKKIKYNFF